MIRVEKDALILGFPRPVRTLSWAVLNGGFCYADYVINHQVSKGDMAFAADPRKWLQQQVHRLSLRGNVVGMATAVETRMLTQTSFTSNEIEVRCFATVGHGNALTVGDRVPSALEQETVSPHTINLILLVCPGLSDEAMVEAVQITTEARVRALYEAGIPSSCSGLPATGTGTDCIAVVSLDKGRTVYCGKHTKIGELVGLASYTAVKKGLAAGRTATEL